MSGIGGVNVQVGIDLKNFARGAKQGKSMLRSFQKDMSNIRLDRAIKGNPFENINKYMLESKKQLDKVFNAWSSNIGIVGSNMSTFANKSKKSIESVITDYKKLEKSMSTFKTGLFGRSQFGVDASGKKIMGSGKYAFKRNITEHGDADKKGITKQLREIQKLAPNIDKIKQRIGKAISDINKGYKVNVDNLYGYVNKVYLYNVKKFEENGERIKSEYRRQNVLRRREETSQANSVNKVQRAKRKELRKILIQEKQLRTNIKANYNVEKNKLALYEKLIQKQKLSGSQSKKLNAELRRMGKEVKKIQGTSDALFSKNWFMSRARWFVQLRGLWAVWRQVSEAVRKAFEFEQEMANVRAIAQTTVKQFDMLKKKALEVGSTTRFSAVEAAQGMVKFAQAGLNANEILEALHHTAQLATATMYDFESTASLITIAMRAWKKEASDVQEITDILATSINKSRLTMDGLTKAFNYITGIAPQVGLSLEETTAILGQMVNRGLAFSTAGTSLRAMLAALLKPTERFIVELRNTELTLDQVDPKFHSIIDILKTLKKAGWDASNTFRAFRRRAASGAAIAIDLADSLDELADSMNQSNRAFEMAQVNLDTMSGQWKQFQDITVASASTILDDLEPAIRVAIELLKGLTWSVTELIKSFVTTPIQGFINALSWLQVLTGPFNDDELRQGLSRLQAQLKDFERTNQDVINSFRRLRDGFSTYEDKIGGFNKGHKGLWEQAMDVAKDLKLINSREIKELKTKEAIEKRINDNYFKRKSLMADQLAKSEIITKQLEGRGSFFIKPEAESIADKIIKLMEDKETQTRKLNNSLIKKFNISGPDIVKNKSSVKKAIESNYLLTLKQQLIKDMDVDIKEATTKLRSYLYSLTSKQQEILLSEIKSFKRTKIIRDVLNPKGLESVVSTKQALANLEEKAGERRKAKDWDKLSYQEKISFKKAEKSQLALEIKMINSKLKVLSKLPSDLSYEEKALKINEKLTKVKLELAAVDFELLKLSAKGKRDRERGILLDTAKQQYNLSKGSIENDKRASLLTIVKKRKTYAINILNNNAQEKINRLQVERIKLERESAPKEKLLEIDKKILEVGKERTIAQVALEDSIDNEYGVKLKNENDLLKQQNKLMLQEEEIRKNIESQKRASDPIHDVWRRIQESQKSFNETMSDTMFKGYQSTKDGFKKIITDATGGFQKAQQEVVNLKGTLSELYSEKEEFLAKDILTEEEAARFAELNTEIAQTAVEIDKLEDPIQNAKLAFRDFAKSVIDDMRNIVNEWIAAQALMGIGQMVSGGMSGFSGLGGNLFSDIGTSLFKASGGVTPQIKSFRKFSSGGTTGSPTMAMLGDNRSGKELVIPSENISNNNVSGYVRDTSESNVTIVNVVTEEDLARELSKTKPGKVIVNHVYRNITAGKELSKKVGSR